VKDSRRFGLNTENLITFGVYQYIEERRMKKIISISILTLFLFTQFIYNISVNVIARPEGWSDDIRMTFNFDLSTEPAIAIYDNNVHIVYGDDEGGSGSNRYLWYLKSLDGGKTWNNKIQLTNEISFVKFPAITINNSNIHIVWFDEKDYAIHYINSTDNGNNWSDNKSLSSSSLVPPDIAVNGNNVHVTCLIFNGSNDEIRYINSTDGGITWSDVQILNLSTSAQAPRIAVNGSSIHIIWNDISEIKYINSTDNGKTWSTISTIETDSGVGDIAVNGNVVHIIYRKLFTGISQIYYMHSEDNGITWSPGKKLTTSTIHIPDGAMVIDNNDIHITWQDRRDDNNGEIYYMYSLDNGENWDEEIRLTYNSSISILSDIAVNGSISHIVWADNRDGNFEIYYKHYPVPSPPTNLEINIWLNNLVLNWTPPLNSPSQVTHYHIYRSTTWGGFDFSAPWIDTAIDSNNGIIPLRTSWNITDALLDEEWDFFYIVRAIDNEGWNDTNMNIVGKYVIHLDKGWNLISLPLIQKNTTISEVLRTIDGAYNIVQWYDAEQGIWRSSTGDLTEINRTMGLWIHMKDAQNLSIIGAVPESTDIALYEGWNLVGYPSFMVRNPNDALSGIKWRAIQQFDAFDSSDPWKHNNTNKPEIMNDLKEMKPGYGYWVYVTINDTWTRTRTVEDNKMVVWQVNGMMQNGWNQLNYKPTYENPNEMKEEDDSRINIAPDLPTVKDNEDNLIISFIPLIILAVIVLAEIKLLRKMKKHN
jgi:hypothetical protein